MRRVPDGPTRVGRMASGPLQAVAECDAQSLVASASPRQCLACRKRVGADHGGTISLPPAKEATAVAADGVDGALAWACKSPAAYRDISLEQPPTIRSGRGGSATRSARNAGHAMPPARLGGGDIVRREHGCPSAQRPDEVGHLASTGIDPTTNRRPRPRPWRHRTAGSADGKGPISPPSLSRRSRGR